MYAKSFRVVAVALAVAGCASAGGAAAPGTATRLERSIGSGSAADVTDRSLKVVRQHLFEIQRQEPPPNIYIESYWRDRAPFVDEEAQGVTRAQTRVIVRAQPRTTSTIAAYYTVDLTIENRVMRQSETWDPTLATPMFNKYADRITQDLKAELNIGVRR